MRIINADVSANYDDVTRKLPCKNSVEISYYADSNPQTQHILFNVFISKREDDYISICIDLEELMTNIAKAIKDENKE